ncbi:MAG: putative permease [Bryobacterales bacterium]|nr:putative permease [Bryobacterales bacterium]
MNIQNLRSNPQPRPAWQHVVLFIVTLLIVCLCLAIAAPFVPAITGAVALAVATRTPFAWLVRKTGRPGVAAALAVILVALLILGPALYLGQELVRQIIGAAGKVQSGEATDYVQGLVDRVPWLGRAIDQFSNAVNLRQAAQTAGEFVATRLQGVLSGSLSTLTQVVLMLFTLFFLFRDQDESVQLFRSLLPLREEHRDHLLERMSNTISATIQGSLTIAGIQGALGGIMFWILDVPNVPLWTFAMAALATIPSLGTFLIWAPVALFLGLTGHWVKAVILTAWGTFVIGTVDNILYPTLVGSKLQLHTVPVLFAVLGGIGLFGISGIVLGPLILTTAVTLLRVWMPGESALPDPTHAESATDG